MINYTFIIGILIIISFLIILLDKDRIKMIKKEGMKPFTFYW